jgi:hypothetical protein
MNYSFSVMRFRTVLAGFALTMPFLGGAPSAMPAASADAVAYLVNVTVRPGYNFANADQALAYGHGVCDKVAQGRPYAQLIADIKNDFNTSDGYQASYLITQSANELCPAQIWQLRNSAAGYTGSP